MTMNPRTDPHLTTEEAVRYAMGECADDAAASRLEVHMAACDTCAAAVRKARLIGRTLASIEALVQGRPAMASAQYPTAVTLSDSVAQGLKRVLQESLPADVRRRVTGWLSELPTPGQVAATAVRVVADAAGLAFVTGGLADNRPGGTFGVFRPALAAVRSGARPGVGETTSPVREMHATSKGRMAQVVIADDGTIEARVQWPKGSVAPLLVLVPMDPSTPPVVQKLEAEEGMPYLRARFARPSAGEYVLVFGPEEK